MLEKVGNCVFLSIGERDARYIIRKMIDFRFLTGRGRRKEGENLSSGCKKNLSKGERYSGRFVDRSLRGGHVDSFFCWGEGGKKRIALINPKRQTDLGKKRRKREIPSPFRGSQSTVGRKKAAG